MDEFIWSPRLMRRMALLGIVNCVALQTTAAELADKPGRPVVAQRHASDQQDFGSLLKQGWKSPAETAARPDSSPAKQPAAGDLTPAVKPQPTVTAAAPAVTTEPIAPIIPPQLTPAEEPEQPALAPGDQSAVPISPTATEPPAAVLEPAEPDEVLKRVEAAGDAVSLSDLLKAAPGIHSEVSGSHAETPAAESKQSSSDHLVEQTLELPRLPEESGLLHQIAADNGFGIMALDDLGLPVVDPAAMAAKPSQSEIIQSARLQEVAQRLLREANNSLRRKADFTARKKATAALRTAIAMRDAVAGDNQHSLDLESALDAIREARDFGVGASPADHAAMKRLVAVHKTAVLKDRDLSNVSPLGAMSSYLEFAQAKLVSAAGQLREASESLLLLSRVEKRSNGSLDPIASAITLTYQRAAAEIDPTNATALYEMGKSLDNAGMVDQARVALTRSIQMAPTCGGYQQLMETARKVGDIDTVKYCKDALADERLLPQPAVVRLEPEVFAGMHRPQAAPRKAAAVPAAPAATQQQNSKLQKASPEVSPMSRLKTWFKRDQ
jgi:hypothetical protein